MRLLLVEDDVKIASFIIKGLRSAGYAVDHALDGETGLDLALSEPYDGVVIDIMLPKRDGLSLIRQLREQKVNTPALILSAKGSVDDRVKGLETGADDYLTKPFSFEELLARIRALLRRPPHITDKTVLQCANLKLDLIKRQAFAGEQEISLSQKEFALLEFLMRHAGEVVSRTAIAEHVWDLHFDPMSNTIDVYINFLRKKIGETPSKSKIETIRGTGYRLACP